jgi:predicted CopG family antitoxin
MVTTIQLNEDIKARLDFLKKHKQTYEDVILSLLNLFERTRRKQKDLLIEGYKEMAEENLKITKEFDRIEEDFDWEW